MIRVISVGKLKEKHYKSAFNEYFKRLNRFTKIEYIEVKTVKQAFKQAKGHIIMLDEKGRQMSSEMFARFIKNKDISFLIGPPKGFSIKEKQEAYYLISLSMMTLPHQLSQVFLIEQIYRAFTIMKHMKYHK